MTAEERPGADAPAGIGDRANTAAGTDAPDDGASTTLGTDAPDDRASTAAAADALRVRPIEPRDHDAVLTLNARDVDKLSPLDQERLEWILARCAAPLVVEDDAGVLGFCFALPAGTDYDGDHYAWFSARYDDFLYLDRIAVSERARRRGAGSLLYAACEELARPAGRMLCEVNAVPLNAVSLAFHHARGYVELERRPTDPTGAKVVAMLAKELAPPASSRPIA